MVYVCLMTDHAHFFIVFLPMSTRVECMGCDLNYRFATYDEAVWIQQTDGFAPDGPLLFNDNGVIVVPYNFSLFQEA